jgi:outer membrane protein assembly factor BamB
LAFFRRPELDLPIQYDTLYPIRLFAQQFDSNKDGALEEEDWKQLEKVQSNYIQNHAVAAIKLDNNGESNHPIFKWKEKDYVPEVPSLLSVDDKIYMIINGGIIVCLDSETGDMIFKDRLGASGAYLASPLYANGYIIFASYNGKVTVIKAIDKLDIVTQCDLREKIGASPVALNDNLFIRTESGLYAFKK